MDAIRTTKLCSRKVKSSSIVEVTVALVIISVVFGIFIMIYTNLISGGKTLQRVKYQEQLKVSYQEMLRSENYVDSMATDGAVTISRKVSRYKNTSDLLLVEMKAVHENGSTWAEQKFLLYVPQR